MDLQISVYEFCQSTCSPLKKDYGNLTSEGGIRAPGKMQHVKWEEPWAGHLKAQAPLSAAVIL